MFNTNVGEMPLDIFCDYISDVLGEEWLLGYLIPIVNGANYPRSMTRGFGYAIHNKGDSYSRGTVGYGSGYGEDVMQMHIGGDGLGQGSLAVFFYPPDMVF